MNSVSIREFRKNLAGHLNGANAVLIGDQWHRRAVLIPLTKEYSYNRPEMQKAIARAAKEMLRILAELRAENRRH